MNLLLYDMGALTQNDLISALTEHGIHVKNIFYKLKNIHEDSFFRRRFTAYIREGHYDAVMSVNYFPVLASVCRDENIKYLSWSYDSPLNPDDLTPTLDFPTNYVFLFDRDEASFYRSMGFDRVYHLPLAVNPARLRKIGLSAEDDRCRADISLVGQLYSASFHSLISSLDSYHQGYLDAVIETQLNLYGCYILRDMLTEPVLDCFNKSFGQIGQDSVRLTRFGLENAVGRHITNIERVFLLNLFSEEFQVSLYGPSKEGISPAVNYHGSAGYFDEMPKIFRLSRINLNPTLKSIRSGIPLRALDIMASGGFLFSNFQPELDESFQDGEEMIQYSSMEDAYEKAVYYLGHENLRRKIALNGMQKTMETFSYDLQMTKLFKAAGLL